MNDIDINMTVKETEFQTVKDLFAFGASVTNILSFAVLGVYIRNDETEINELKEFIKNNYESGKGIRSKAETVYKWLKEGEKIPFNGDFVSLKEVADFNLSELPFTMSSAYDYVKAQKEAAKPPKPAKGDIEAAKRAIDSQAIDTQGIKSPKQFLELMANPALAEVMKTKLDQAKLELQAAEMASQLPEVTSDNLETLKPVLKQYLKEIFQSFPEDFAEITDYILEIQTGETESEAQAA